MESLTHCPICRRKMMVYESREQTFNGFHTVLRRRKCPVHPDTRNSSLELPKDIALEVLRDD